MKGSTEKTGELTAKQEKAIAALLERGTVKEAAQAAKVSDVTLWRWLQDETFQRRYRESRAQVVETAISEMQSACSVAVRTLKNVCEDTTAPASARVAAARAILEQSIKGVEQTELIERLKILEAAIEQTEGKKR